MPGKTLVVTGSSGLIGSEVVRYFDERGWSVHGLDNNMRADFFGPLGDTRWNQHRLEAECRSFVHHEIDIRQRRDVLACVEQLQPELIVHAAAQPSHDLAAKRPFDDFDVNAGGTLNLLEATRQFTPGAVFVYLSTNKVYGDAPNELPLIERATRWDYAKIEDYGGIREDMRIDRSKHSLFGASKVAADVMVQEYGRYFGIATCCIRGGCLTGPNHSGVELHGFLSYLVRVNVTRQQYRIYGHKGKQVRDNVHAYDVAHFIELFYSQPRVAEVYNLGGGRGNSCSILEAFGYVEQLSGVRMQFECVDQAREGDHICYISDLTKIQRDYPEWRITKSLEDIFTEIYVAWRARMVEQA